MARKTTTAAEPADPTDPTNPTADPDAGFDAGPGGQETLSDPGPPPAAAPEPTEDEALADVIETRKARERAHKRAKAADEAHEAALQRYDRTRAAKPK